MAWEKVTTVDRLAAGPVVVRNGPKQIALFQTSGRVFAVDNRCPHEGYPLAQGTIDQNCVLTCNWHNWKFRLSDGRCIMGGDDVRSYAVELRDGQVWVDVSDPPPKELQRSILAGLKLAFDKRDFGRICREISRLHFNGLDPLAAVRRAIVWSHDKFEFGFTHAYAASADWLARYDACAGDWERQLICLSEAVDHLAHDALREPTYAYAPAADAFDLPALAAAIEDEQHEAAEALVRRGLDDGLHWLDLEATFVTAALAHYNDFGHSLIYVYKTSQLVARFGLVLEPPLILALTRHLCYTTREDLLPEFRGYADALRRLERLTPDVQLGWSEAAGLLDTHERPEIPFPASLRDATKWLEEKLPTMNVTIVFDALLESLARSLLHFDTSYGSAYDRPVQDNVGWLDFTHGVTFANAVRHVCHKYPRFWRAGLLQMALFVGRNRQYLDLEIDEVPWLVAYDTAFLAGLYERMLDHGLPEPIFSAHWLKTTVAVEQELTAASPTCSRYLLAGLNRFVNSPLKQKHARRLARQAIELVERDFQTNENSR